MSFVNRHLAFDGAEEKSVRRTGEEDAVLVSGERDLAAVVGDPLPQLEVEALESDLGSEPAVGRTSVLEEAVEERDLGGDGEGLEFG